MRKLGHHGVKARGVFEFELVDGLGEADRVVRNQDQPEPRERSDVGGERSVGRVRPPAPDERLELPYRVRRLGATARLGVASPLGHLVGGHVDAELSEGDVALLVAPPGHRELADGNSPVPASYVVRPDALGVAFVTCSDSLIGVCGHRGVLPAHGHIGRAGFAVDEPDRSRYLQISTCEVRFGRAARLRRRRGHSGARSGLLGFWAMRTCMEWPPALAADAA